MLTFYGTVIANGADAMEIACPPFVVHRDRIANIFPGWTEQGLGERLMPLTYIGVGSVGGQAAFREDEGDEINGQYHNVWRLDNPKYQYTIVCLYFGSRSDLTYPLPPHLKRCETTFPMDRRLSTLFTSKLICH